MRAAIYARFSSDLQRPTSIADQTRECRARADQLGATVVETYADAALSGGDARHRPALQRLLADARAGRFDLVVAEALDRVSRDQEDTAAIFKRLRFAGVTLVTISEGEISELHVGLRGTMNAMFLRDLAQKIRRGQRGRVSAGRNAGGIAYGYRPKRRLDERGELVRGERVIEEREAEIVRRIFREFVAGAPAREIAIGLNVDRIPGPRGGIWRASQVKGSRKLGEGIVRNPLYRGRIEWNRRTYARDPDTGRRVVRLAPADQRIGSDVPELAIVDGATWAAAQRRLAEDADRPPRLGRPSKHLLSGLIRCGVCGSAFHLSGGDRLRCSRSSAGACDNGKTVRLGNITGRVLEGLRASLLDPAVVRAAADEYRATRAARRAKASQRASQREREASDLEGRRRRLVDLLETGAGDSTSLVVRLREIEARLAELRADEALPAPVDLMPNASAAYRRMVDAFLAADVPAQAARELRALIDQVVIHPRAAKGAFDAELVGSLAALIAPRSADVPNRESARSVKGSASFALIRRVKI